MDSAPHLPLIPLTRRATMLGAAAALLAPRRLAAAETILRAAPAEARLAPADFPETPVWVYGGTVPGPELRVRRGERLRARLENGLPQPTTIHWHGIRIENAMDGAAGLTQGAVEPGAGFLYDFVAPDAGTYWYHPHERSWEQLARGLYGPLIVEEDEPPDIDLDLPLLLDDWRMTADATIDESFGAMMDLSHAGRIGNWITVNGAPEFSRPVRRGQRLRLRLANTANARIFDLSFRGLEGVVAALDGQPLARPAPLGDLRLAPAQRADLIVDVTAEDEAVVASAEREGAFVIAALPVEGEAPARDAPPAPLPPNHLLEPAAAPDLEARLLMEGGAMGRMAAAQHNGERMDIRALVAEGMAWAFNGVAGMPETPLFAAPLGATVRLEMVNDTAWPHAIHLHGHHVRRIDGAGPGPWRDTVLLERAETATVAFVAHNPGRWMLHCHMLEHQAAGMMTWFEVG